MKKIITILTIMLILAVTAVVANVVVTPSNNQIQFDKSVMVTESGNGIVFHGGGESIISGSGHHIHFRTSHNTERMIITNDGNVGIGLSDPDYTLSVRGSSGNSIGNGVLLIQGSGTSSGLELGSTSGSGFIQAGSGYPTPGFSGHRPLYLNPSGGNVGIGTTSPNSNLHISSERIFRTPGSDVLSITRIVSNDGVCPRNDYQIQFSNQFNVNNRQRNGDLNVGGTFSDRKITRILANSHSICVDGSSTWHRHNRNSVINNGADGVNLRNNAFQIGEGTNKIVTMGHFQDWPEYGTIWLGDVDTLGTRGVNNYALASNGNLLSLNAQYILNFRIWGDNVMHVTSSGLGIGTTTPEAQLEILQRGNAATSGGVIRLSNNKDHPFENGARIGAVEFHSYYPGTGTGTWASIQAKADGRFSDGSQLRSTRLEFHTTGSSAGAQMQERMRITADGNVGIGTSDPQAKLHVNGNIKVSDGNAFILGTGKPSGTLQKGMMWIE